MIGNYPTDIEAAVAYNKAADILQQNKCPKKFEKNYIDKLDSKEYHRLYDSIAISQKIIDYRPPSPQ